MFKQKPLIVAVLLLLALSSLIFGSVSAASDGLAAVTLSVQRTSFAASQPVIIRVTVSNPNERPIKVLKWYTPAEDVEEPLFTVTLNGAAIQYVGAHYKRPEPTGNDYINLKPGESFTRDVDLATYYDFSASGSYQITYDVGSWNLYSEKGNESKQVQGVTSNSVEVFVEGRAAFTPLAVTGGTSFNKCTVSQQNDLITARTAASSYATNALSYLNSNNQGPRYTTWFGVYNSSRYNTVKSNFAAISSAIDTAAIKFDCGCKKSYYAYVYPTQPYNIYLCRVFWTTGMTGTDSKAGTLIHEMSHFNVVAGTDDWAYGQTNAKNLAISNPDRAVDNADNHEYFAENTPAQN